MDFYLILALGPRNGLGYCVVNQHKVKGEIIIIIIIIIITIIIITAIFLQGAHFTKSDINSVRPCKTISLL